MEVYRAHMLLKELWIWCKAFDNDRTGADNKQQPVHQSTSTMENCVCQPDTLIRADKQNTLS